MTKGEFCPNCGRVKWEHHPICPEPWVETPREARLEVELTRTRKQRDAYELLWRDLRRGVDVQMMFIARHGAFRPVSNLRKILDDDKRRSDERGVS